VGSAGKTDSLKPKRIFEIGTFHGYTTTLQMGLDAPVDSEIFTLDLSPESDSSSLDMASLKIGSQLLL
jgi:predicted O-methyltransferase YrrM